MPTIEEFCKKEDKTHHYCLKVVEPTGIKRKPSQGGQSDEGFNKMFPNPFDVYSATSVNHEALWSNKKPLPSIGEKVTINFNGLGTGTVDSYFMEGEWLGIAVRLDNEPDWHKKACPDFPYAMVFGAEIA
jgi:hypothetical protein